MPTRMIKKTKRKLNRRNKSTMMNQTCQKILKGRKKSKTLRTRRKALKRNQREERAQLSKSKITMKVRRKLPSKAVTVDGVVFSPCIHLKLSYYLWSFWEFSIQGYCQVSPLFLPVSKRFTIQQQHVVLRYWNITNYVMRNGNLRELTI